MADDLDIDALLEAPYIKSEVYIRSSVYISAVAFVLIILVFIVKFLIKGKGCRR